MTDRDIKPANPIHYNDKGPAVLALQRGILAAGGALPRYGADGHLGAETWAALVELGARLGVRVAPVDLARAGRAAVPPEVVAHLVSRTSASSGLLVANEVVPGTEWIRRDPSAWWENGERGTRARAAVTDILVGHWTAGHPHTVRVNAGPKVVRAMKARLRDDGSPLNVGIHFVIAWDGEVWQTMDLAHAATHVGIGAVNARSIGVECCWPGTAAWASRLGVTGPTERVLVGGRRVECLVPSAELLAAWVRLAETLAALDGRGGVRVPRRVPPSMARWTRAEQGRWAGAQEHAHVPGSTKVDAAGYLMRALVAAGWSQGG